MIMVEGKSRGRRYDFCGNVAFFIARGGPWERVRFRQISRGALITESLRSLAGIMIANFGSQEGYDDIQGFNLRAEVLVRQLVGAKRFHLSSYLGGLLHHCVSHGQMHTSQAFRSWRSYNISAVVTLSSLCAFGEALGRQVTLLSWSGAETWAVMELRVLR
jgi:hypothetical protein